MSDLTLSRLKIENFRNINGSIISFGKGINCIFGPNGNGKTNLLEAVYLITNGKSFKKNASFPQYLSMDGDKPEISFLASFNAASENYSYSGKLIGNGKKNWHVRHDFLNLSQLPVSLLVDPFDSYNFHNSTSFRRHWFDQQIGKLDSSYKLSLNRYNKALRQRNKLLSLQPKSFKSQIKALDEQLARCNFEITQRRSSFLAELGPYTESIFKEIFYESHILEFCLEASYSQKSIEEVFVAMQSSLERDILVRHTRKGVHRDDFIPLFDGLNALEYCSLGQQKMAYFSLLFAYIELFRYKFVSYPIVLIDDVSGELDKHRWGNLISFLKEKKFQVLITTANDKFRAELDRINGANKLEVELGSFVQYQ